MTTTMHNPPARESYRPGDRVTVLGTRRGTVTTPTDARGFSTVTLDNGDPDVRMHSDVLRPVPTEGNVPTSALRVDDIVATGAGWVLLTADAREYGREGEATVYALDGRVLALAEQIAAGNDTARWVRAVNRGAGNATPDDDWTVQGNDLARWTREARA